MFDSNLDDKAAQEGGTNLRRRVFLAAPPPSQAWRFWQWRKPTVLQAAPVVL